MRRPTLGLAIAATFAPPVLACGEGGLSLRGLVDEADAIVRAVPVREFEDEAGRFVDLRIERVIFGEAPESEIRVWTPRGVAADDGLSIGSPAIVGLHRPGPGEYLADPRFRGAAVPVGGGSIRLSDAPSLESALGRIVPAARGANRSDEAGDPLRPILPALIADPEPRIRRFALDAYAAAGTGLGEAEVRALLDAFESERDPWVARGFIEVFRRAGVREAAALLLPRALDGQDGLVAEEAIRALGELGDRRVAAEALPGALTGPAARRSRAIRLLGALRLPETAGILRLALVDGETREAALKALGELGTEEAIEALERAAASRMPRVRSLAIEALIRDRTPRADAALRQLASEGRGCAAAIERFRSFGPRRGEGRESPATRR